MALEHTMGLLGENERAFFPIKDKQQCLSELQLLIDERELNRIGAIHDSEAAHSMRNAEHTPRACGSLEETKDYDLFIFDMNYQTLISEDNCLLLEYLKNNNKTVAAVLDAEEIKDLDRNGYDNYFNLLCVSNNHEAAISMVGDTPKDKCIIISDSNIINDINGIDFYIVSEENTIIDFYKKIKSGQNILVKRR